MTHATRFAAVAVLVALAVGAPVQAQTPEIDALRVRAEQGDVEAQNNLGDRYATGEGVAQDEAVVPAGSSCAYSATCGLKLTDPSRRGTAWFLCGPMLTP